MADPSGVLAHPNMGSAPQSTTALTQPVVPTPPGMFAAQLRGTAQTIRGHTQPGWEPLKLPTGQAQLPRGPPAQNRWPVVPPRGAPHCPHQDFNKCLLELESILLPPHHNKKGNETVEGHGSLLLQHRLGDMRNHLSKLSLYTGVLECNQELLQWNKTLDILLLLWLTRQSLGTRQSQQPKEEQK